MRSSLNWGNAGKRQRRATHFCQTACLPAALNNFLRGQPLRDPRSSDKLSRN